MLDCPSPPYCLVESEDGDDPKGNARRQRIAPREAEAAAEAARLEPDPVRDLAEHNERGLVVAHREIARTNKRLSQVQDSKNPW